MANIPIISSYGHQVIPVPTVLLTRHTGFDDFKVHHLGNFFDQTIDDLFEHHQKIDAILIGYLDGKEQIAPIMKLLDHYPDAFVFVDPICADNGKFYHGKNQDYVEALKPLIQRADLIKPNITEALVLGHEAAYTPVTEMIVNQCINSLKTITNASIILTGINNNSEIKNILVEQNTVTCTFNKYIDCYYPGTGDIFDSIVLSCLLNKHNLNDCVKLAADSVVKCILSTSTNNIDNPMHGCSIESVICKVH